LGYTSIWLPREGLWLGRYISLETLNNPNLVDSVYIEGCHVLKK